MEKQKQEQVINHDTPVAVRDADRIIVLNQGEIQDMSPHDELLQRKELYRRLCQMQLVTVARSSAST